jgi:AcrR family transcriptional regulator
MARCKEFDIDVALKSAIQTFRTHGYEGTSLRDLTDSMGIHKASLYDTFGDKRQLFLASLRDYLTQSHENVAALFTAAKSTVEALHIILSLAICDESDPEKQQTCLCVIAAASVASKDAEVRDLLYFHREKLNQIFATAICRAQSSGEIRMDIAPSDAADYVVATFFGLHILARMHPRSENLCSAVEIAVKSLRP